MKMPESSKPVSEGGSGKHPGKHAATTAKPPTAKA
jgi:hypothetical protein